MPDRDKKTIKDKLPVGYRYGRPLYYCEEDDTLHNSLDDEEEYP